MPVASTPRIRSDRNCYLREKPKLSLGFSLNLRVRIGGVNELSYYFRLLSLKNGWAIAQLFDDYNPLYSDTVSVVNSRYEINSALHIFQVYRCFPNFK